VRTRGATQFVFVDTPGFQTRHGQALNRNLNRAVRSSLADVDLVLLVVEAGHFGADDARVVELLPPGVPAILVANKLDRVQRRAELLPWLQQLPRQHDFAEYVPMSCPTRRPSWSTASRSRMPCAPRARPGGACTSRPPSWSSATRTRAS
jgi:GTP-binding protein Era